LVVPVDGHERETLSRGHHQMHAERSREETALGINPPLGPGP